MDGERSDHKPYIGKIVPPKPLLKGSRIADADFADEVIRRLNTLCEDPAVRADVALLLANRIPCAPETVAHPTIQTGERDGVPTVGMLGILNGLCGVRAEAPRKGWGYIGGVFKTAEGALVGFQHTVDAEGTNS